MRIRMTENISYSIETEFDVEKSYYPEIEEQNLPFTPETIAKLQEEYYLKGEADIPAPYEADPENLKIEVKVEILEE